MAEAIAVEKKVKFCEKEYDMDTGVCHFTFGNGTELQLDTNTLTEDIQLNLRLHGAVQKVGDSFSGVKGNFAEGIANAQGVIEALKAGNWGVERGDARPRLAELAQAIAKLKNAPLEKATLAVESANDEQRAAWRSNPAVKHAIQEIRLEAAQAALAEAKKQGVQELQVDFA